MNKPIVYAGIGLGVAAIGYLAYRLMQQPSQSYSPTSVSPYSDPTFTTNPYQTYPFTANVAPRVDNSNQPWANNNRGVLNGASALGVDVNLTNVNMMADILKSGSTIIDSGQSIWDSVSSWWGSGDADAWSSDWSGMDTGLTDWSSYA